MLSFAIDGLELINSSSYVLEGADGLDAPDFRVTNYENPGEDGGTVSSSFYGSRTVTLTGIVSGTSSAAYYDARQALAYACRVRKDSSGFPTPTEFDFTTGDGASYFLDGFIKSYKCETKYATFGHFIIQVMVPNPMIFGASGLTSGQVGRPTGGGATFPWTFPVTFGSSTGGSATIDTSPGNADTWPLLYIRGVATNPRLYSIERGKDFQLNYTSNAGDLIVVDMKQKTVMLNGSTSLLSYKTSDSEWFSLVSGSNTVLFTTASAGDTATLEVTANPAYIGV